MHLPDMFFLRTLCTTVICFLMSSTSFICIRVLVSLLDAEIIQKTASQKSDWKYLLLLNLAKQWPLFSSTGRCLFQDNLCFPRPPCYCSSWNVTAAFQNWATSSKFYSKHLRDRQSNIASNLNFLPTVKFTVLRKKIGTCLYSCRLSGKSKHDAQQKFGFTRNDKTLKSPGGKLIFQVGLKTLQHYNLEVKSIMTFADWESWHFWKIHKFTMFAWVL